jgi:hypothetical protein
MNGTTATWNQWNALKKQIANMNSRVPIVNRLIAKNKERLAHAATGNKTTALRSKNWANKQLKINRELAKMENNLLFGVRTLNKIKNRKEAAAARGRNIGRFAKSTFEYRPPAPGIGNFGGSQYRKTKRRFNIMTGKVGTSPKHAKV